MSQKLPPKNPMPIDFEEMEFTIENEEWNEYELKDGARIRGRIILSKIIRDPYNPNTFSFDFSKPVWVVSAPIALRGESNWNGVEKDASKFEVHVDINHEPWNVYRIVKTDQKVKIKLTATEVNRWADKYDKKGLPVYDVPNQVSFNISQKKN
jgi:hypothetical protein